MSGTGNPYFASVTTDALTLNGVAIQALPFGANVKNVLALGADPTGATNSSAAFQTALTALGSSGGCCLIPPGKYKVAGAVLNIAAGKSVTIQGAGPDITEIYSATGATPIAIVLADGTATFHIRDLSVTTAVSNVASGIDISVTGVGQSIASSDITNVTVRSSDSTTNTGTHYFSIGIDIHKGVSSVNFNNVSMPGSTAYAGIGVRLIGDTVGLGYGIIYNFVNCAFNYMGGGLVYGSYIQGVAITNTNFTGNSVGIYVPTGSTGQLYELVISSSQLNNTSSDINAGTLLSDVNITTSNFGPFGSRNSFYSIVGVFANMTVVGNTFIDAFSGTGDGAIVTASGSNAIAVVGNTFIGSWDTAVWFQSGTTNANLQSNIYYGPSTASNPASDSGSIKIGGGSK